MTKVQRRLAAPRTPHELETATKVNSDIAPMSIPRVLVPFSVSRFTIFR
jgi:hypothetical protein